MNRQFKRKIREKFGIVGNFGIGIMKDIIYENYNEEINFYNECYSFNVKIIIVKILKFFLEDFVTNF